MYLIIIQKIQLQNNVVHKKNICCAPLINRHQGFFAGTCTQVLSLHFLEQPVGNLGYVGLKYLTSQVELRIKLVVTGVDVKLNKT